MDRRTFIGTCAGSLLAVRCIAEAQQPPKIARVGYLMNGAPGSPEAQAFLDAFRQGLRERGYVEGQNILIEYRAADGKIERLPGLASELARLNLDVIVAGATPGARAAQQATTTTRHRGCNGRSCPRWGRGKPCAAGCEYHGVNLPRPGAGPEAYGTAQGSSSEGFPRCCPRASRRIRRAHDEGHVDRDRGRS